jgi:hypothetical protein
MCSRRRAGISRNGEFQVQRNMMGSRLIGLGGIEANLAVQPRVH